MRQPHRAALKSAANSNRKASRLARAVWLGVERLEPRTLLTAVPVLTYHNDAASTGQNLQETVLTPGNVNVNKFHRAYSTPVDGQVYAQPLYEPGLSVTVNGQTSTHNVAFVATEGDSLYAIDADSGNVLWQDTFFQQDPALTGTATVTTVPNSDVSTTDIQPKIGITSTPSIDPATGFLFLTAKTKQVVSGATGAHYVYTLEKVNIHDGTFTSTVIGDTTYSGGAYNYTGPGNSGPYVLGSGAGAVSVGGQQRVYFNALREMNRSAVTLYNGNVYMSFASHGDNGPYHGWILGFKEADLSPTAAFCTNPNGGLDGIWMGGGKIAIDPQGFMYVETGNGTFDTTLNAQGFPSRGDYGDSFLKIGLDPTTTQTSQNINGWGLKVVDYFTPSIQDQLSGSDQDLGSGGPMVLPDSIGNITIGNAQHPHLLVGSGKDGVVYLLDRDNMGKYDPNTDHVVQELQGLGGFGSFNTPALFYDGSQARIYYVSEASSLDSFVLQNATVTEDTSSTDTYAARDGTPSVSANGTANGIVWAIDAGVGELRAYNASNLTELYTSSQNAGRDALGTGIKFSLPTISNGQVFVGTGNALVTYGLIAPPTSLPAAPTNLAATAGSNVQINLTWADNANNEDGYLVEQSNDGGNTWNQIAMLGTNATAYSVLGLSPATTYSFRVRAFNSLGNSDYTNTASATTQKEAGPISFPNGFTGSGSALTLNGTAVILGSKLRLTNGGQQEAASAFANSAVSVRGFNTTFTFQLSNPSADGMTFTIQGVGPTALGGPGGGLGYANDFGNGGIPNSVAIKFDLWSNQGEGTDSTGLFVDGDSPTLDFNPPDQSVDLSDSGIDLHSGDVMQVNLAYDGKTLNETITDTVTKATLTQPYAINIPSFVGGSFGFVGFTAGTGGATATQDVLSWTYNPVQVAPDTPTKILLTQASGTEVDLEWTDTAPDVGSYQILREDPGQTTFKQVGQVPGDTTRFNDTGLTPGTTYTYELVATNAAGSSAPSNPASITTPTTPAAPTNLVVSNVTTNSVTLSWKNNANNALFFVITRQLESDNSQYVATISGLQTTYTDNNVLPGREYAYNVAATNKAGPSDGADAVVETVPAAPTGLAARPGGDRVVLDWTDNGHAVTGYNVYRSTTPGGEGATPIAKNLTGTHFVDTGLTAGTKYYYQITAVDGGGTFGGTGTGQNQGLPILGGGESARSAEVSSLAYVPGDANGDGKVNFTDLLILAQAYGKTGTTIAQGDFNGDGKTDFADLLILSQNYGAGSAASTFSTEFIRRRKVSR